MKVKHNYLPAQYKKTGKLGINHNYLIEQFSDYKEIFEKIEKLVQKGDYTLGTPVEEFEKKFSSIAQTKYAIGVGSGTDALFLSLKALDIKKGDEVITAPNSFIATAGAIVAANAKPVFVDVRDDYNINPELIERAITDKTKVIMPVHWSGLPCDMHKIMEIAKRRGIPVIEDAAQAIKANIENQVVGSFGLTGCFSFHPLKNLNAWGDGGIITTNNSEIYEKLVLLRNHGLRNRDECEIYGYNSRLDSIQAVVANHLLSKIDYITNTRISNAKFYDEELSKIKGIQVPERKPNIKQVFHIYVIRSKERDRLQRFLIKWGIDAKIHYPLPMHLQPAAQSLGYKKGDFPICESICESILSLPVHEFIKRDQQDYVIKKIREFYK